MQALNPSGQSVDSLVNPANLNRQLIDTHGYLINVPSQLTNAVGQFLL